MKSYDFDAVVYNSEIYCIECLPEGVTEDSEEVMPIFADSEWDLYPVCTVCHEIHDYVNLTIEGQKYELEQKQKQYSINEKEKFWKHLYHVYLSEITGYLKVNADHEQDALDYAIDYAEEMGWEGLFFSNEEINNMPDEEIDEYICSGNHCRYLNSHNVTIEQVDNRDIGEHFGNIKD